MYKPLLIFVCALLLSPAVIASDIVHPTGIYSSHVGQGVHKYINAPHVNGALVRVKWSEIEPKEGQFNFAKIEQQRQHLVNAGKNWSLAVIAGPNTPQWLMHKANNRMTIQFRKKTKTIIPFWDKTYLTYAEKLAMALAQRYGEDPNLVLIYVPQQTANGIEGHFNGTPFADLKTQGLNRDNWMKGVEGSIRAYSRAFPDKAIAFEIHEIFRKTDIAESIIRYIQKEHKEQVGIGVWWLSGKWTYQGDLLRLIANSHLPVYAQVIGKSSQKHRFPNGDYLEVFKQAKDIGAQYIEVWNYELEQSVPQRITNAIKSF